MNIVLASIGVAAVYLAGMALGFPALVSLPAALLLALFPTRLNVELFNDTDADLVAALTVIAISATSYLVRNSKMRAVQLGLLWGGVLLAAPMLALIYLSLLVIGFRKHDLRKAAVITLIVTSAVLLPWTVRNRLTLGSWFFIRDNLGLEFRVSNADNAAADSLINLTDGAMATFHPFVNRDVADLVRRDGETAVYSRLGSDAVHWIFTHRTRFAELTIARLKYFWLPAGTTRKQLLWRIVLWLFAAAGLFFQWKRNRVSAILLTLLLVLYPLPYYLVQSYSR